MTTAADLQAEFESMVADDFFGEGVIYTPFGGTAKPIRAVVYRRGVRRVESNRDKPDIDFIKYKESIRISRNATNGIAEIKERQDTVSIAQHIGGEMQSHRVAEVLREDPATYLLGLS